MVPASSIELSRVPPEDPGGEAADHQGLAVNAVAAQGTVSEVKPDARNNFV